MKSKLIIISLLFALSVATAGKFDQASINRVQASQNNNSPIVPSSTPDSVVTLDFGLMNAESWDGLNDVDNMIANCVSRGTITGFEFTNVTIETVGGSWLSEATMLFTDSTGTGGVTLTLGIGDDMAGTATYSSGGIIDLTDNMIPDIVALGDGLLPIQFYESFDDNANAIDATFTTGTLDVWGINIVADRSCGFVAPIAIIPATNWYWLAALFLMLVVFGRRFIKS